MRPLTAVLRDELARVERRGGVAAGIYLTRQHTTELIHEAGQQRDRRFTRTQQFDRFEGVPLYTDRDVSMIVWYDSAADGHTTLL